MKKRSFKAYSLNTLRRYIVLGSGLGLLVGCQGKTVDEPAHSSSEISKSEIKGELTAFSTPVIKNSLQAPSLDLPSPTVKTPEPEPVDPRTVAAEVLFAKLVNPGLSMEDWEQTHTQLLEIGESAVPVLAKGLSSTNNIERETAATTLALLGPFAKGASTELIAALADSSPFVKANAAAALVLIAGQEAVAIPVLVETLHSSDPNLRQMAAMNLNAVGREASPHVAELTRVLMNEQSPEVLVPVVQLLGRIGPGAALAVPKLQQIAFEQPGELSTEANFAIEQIQTASGDSETFKQ